MFPSYSYLSEKECTTLNLIERSVHIFLYCKYKYFKNRLSTLDSTQRLQEEEEQVLFLLSEFLREKVHSPVSNVSLHKTLHIVMHH